MRTSTLKRNAALDRAGAVSPAESLASTNIAAGVKRKERDFESESVMSGGGEETNINVVVRLRGRSPREVKENSTVVVKADSLKGNHVELSLGPNALSHKTYSFDRVYSPAADQTVVFDDTVRPILDEVCLLLALRGCVPHTDWIVFVFRC